MKPAVKKRCILIFPEFENGSLIDDTRKKYDPNYKNVPPHITLVFPFESNISKEEILKHVRSAIEGASCFHLKLHGIKRMDGEVFYLMLGVLEGASTIRELHDKLYTGILRPYKPDWPGGFMPHMTLGQFSSSEELSEAYNTLAHLREEFYAKICKVSVEIIGKKSESIIEFESYLDQD